MRTVLKIMFEYAIQLMIIHTVILFYKSRYKNEIRRFQSFTFISWPQRKEYIIEKREYDVWAS